LQGEDISGEAIIESDMARTYAANRNLEIISGIISVLVLAGLLAAFLIMKFPVSREAALIGGSLVLGFTVVWRLFQSAMRYGVQRRSLETVITELTALKARAKEDAATQRALAEQLKSLEVEVTRVRADAAEARAEAARLRARKAP
jgi:cytochrome c biogenesis protein CcdA